MTIRRIVPICGAVLALGLSTAPLNTAQGAPTPSPTPEQRSYAGVPKAEGLWIKGVDEGYARKAGYSVKRLSGGKFQLVPLEGRGDLKPEPVIDPAAAIKAAKSKSEVNSAYPWNTHTSSGNCGTNYNTVEQTGANKVYVQSGFSLSNGRRALEVDWKLKLEDQNGVSYQSVPTQYPNTISWYMTRYNLNQYGFSIVKNVVGSASSVVATNGYYCLITATTASISLQ